MGKEGISRVRYMPLLQVVGAQAQPNFEVPFYLYMHPLTQLQNLLWGVGLFLGGSAMPLLKGGVPVFPFEGSFICAYNISCRTTKCDVVTSGEGPVS